MRLYSIQWQWRVGYNRIVIRKAVVAYFNITNREPMRHYKSRVCTCIWVGPLTSCTKSKASVRLIKSFPSEFWGQHMWIKILSKLGMIPLKKSAKKTLCGFGGLYTTATTNRASESNTNLHTLQCHATFFKNSKIYETGCNIQWLSFKQQCALWSHDPSAMVSQINTMFYFVSNFVK